MTSLAQASCQALELGARCLRRADLRAKIVRVAEHSFEALCLSDDAVRRAGKGERAIQPVLLAACATDVAVPRLARDDPVDDVALVPGESGLQPLGASGELFSQLVGAIEGK